jgi:hypothetical protein
MKVSSQYNLLGRKLEKQIGKIKVQTTILPLKKIEPNTK